MAEFRLSVDEDTESALQKEADMLGFAGPAAYLDWIVENRTAIERGTDAPRLVEDYRERVEALEERLAAAGVDPDAVAGESVSDARPATGPSGSAGTDPPPASGSGPTVDTLETSADLRHHRPDTGGSTDVGTDAGAGGDLGGQEIGPDAIHATDATEATDETDATDATTTDDDQPRAASDGGVAAADEFSSMHLTPERVQRVSEDAVAEDADSLSAVETKRIDELSRRAVAETRQRLDRDVETGLEYDATSPLANDGVRPGEDLADLDALSVPGRTEELVERRRVAVGLALAHLHDGGSARKSDLVEALYDEHPAGYETPAGWWRCVRGALEQVDAVDGGPVWTVER